MQQTKVTSVVAYSVLAGLMTGLIALLSLFLPSGHRVAAEGAIIYVDADATGAGTGRSWSDAFVEVQSALAVANAGDAIWIAEGVYYPDYDPDSSAYTGSVTATFELVDGVALYGGFVGTETSREQRDWSAHPTILSGDLDRNDANADGNHILETWKGIAGGNARWVVTSGKVSRASVLDGLFITSGGRFRAYAEPLGGGMYNEEGSPTLTRLVFSGNVGSTGGGLLNWGGNPLLINVKFSGNYAVFGGGMRTI
jgi:hypothetical protein